MDATSLLVFAAALVVASGSPGPSIAALVARVLSRGPGEVMPFLAAMWIGEAIWLSLAVWGLSAVAQSFHLAFVALKWLGVAYLLYLAWTMWHAPVDLDDDEVAPVRGSAWRLFAAGIAVTLGNPKIMVFYLALLPTIVDLRHLTTIGWLELTATMFLVLVVIDVAWVLLAARARLLLRSPRGIRFANRLGAGTMAGAAAAIASR